MTQNVFVSVGRVSEEVYTVYTEAKCLEDRFAAPSVRRCVIRQILVGKRFVF